MLSASVAHRVLLIDGTPRADSIVLTRGKRAVSVNVNGQVSQFSLKSFSTIRIRAGKGDDLVTIGTNDNPIAAAASVFAGGGNDQVITGAGNDSVYGEDGDDEISAGGGNDVAHGGAGHDTIFGGDGNDNLFGDSQADSVYGSAGDDNIHGGRGDDELHDGAGKDLVFGDDGTDHFCVAEGRREFRDVGKGEAMTTDNLEYQPVATPGATGDGVLVRYTIVGDANLDGTIDFTDLLKIAEQYNTDVPSEGDYWWSRGDFNYDGNVDFEDLVKLAQNYNGAGFNDLVKLAQDYNDTLPSDPVPAAPVDFD